MLVPPLVIENCLSCDVDYKISDKKTDRMQAQGIITKGREAVLHEVDISSDCIAALKIGIPGFEWSNTISVETSSDPQPLKLLDDKKRPLTLYAQMRHI